MNVLIIDDSRIVKLLVKDFLINLGYQVFEAEHGAAGLEFLKLSKVDLILLDYNMPVLDGPGFLKEYKGNLKGEIPVIMMTTENSLEKIQEMLSLGAAEYMMKPVDQGILKEKIQMVMNS